MPATLECEPIKVGQWNKELITTYKPVYLIIYEVCLQYCALEFGFL